MSECTSQQPQTIFASKLFRTVTSSSPAALIILIVSCAGFHSLQIYQNRTGNFFISKVKAMHFKTIRVVRVKFGQVFILRFLVIRLH